MLSRSWRGCPGAERWERARSGSLDGAFAAHLAACAACADAWQRDDALRELARGLPGPALSRERLLAGRESLLLRARSELAQPVTRRDEMTVARPARRAGWSSLAVAVLLLAWLGFRGTVPARDRLDSSLMKSPVGVNVAEHALRAAQASAATLASRRVEVAPRPRFVPARALLTADAAPATDATTELVALGDASEAAFREGWVALRAGNPEVAALWFGRVAGGSALAEDAQYWQGASLARARRLDQAAEVLTAFVERHPRSLRRHEAAVMLGWVHLQRDEGAEAASYFAQALLTTDPMTRKRAAEGLLVLQRRGAKRAL